MSDTTKGDATSVQSDTERLQLALDGYSHSSLLQILDRLSIHHDEATRKTTAVAYLASFLGSPEHVASVAGRVSARGWSAVANAPFDSDAASLRSLKVRLAALGADSAEVSADLQSLLTHGVVVVEGALPNKEKISFSSRLLESGRYDSLRVISFPLIRQAAARAAGHSNALAWESRAPAQVRAGGFGDLQRDAYLVLRAAAEGRLRITAKGIPFRADVAKLTIPTGAQTSAKTKGRKAPAGPASPRLWFALACLMDSPLVELFDDRLTSTAKTRAYLTAAPSAQAHALLDAYLGCLFSEFFRLTTLQLDYYVDPEVAWVDPVAQAYGGTDIPAGTHLKQARSAVLAVLREGARRASSGGWLSLRALKTALRADHADFLVSANPAYAHRSYWAGNSHNRCYEGIRRPDKPYPDNLLRRGADWDEVEGAYATQLLREPLYWLGLIDLGFDAANDLVAVRLTPLGRHALLDEPAPPDERQEGRAPGLIVQPNFDLVVLDASGSLGLLAQLDDFADRLTLDRAATYRLTRDSVVRGLDRGLSGPGIVETLERESGAALPQNVSYTILEWARLFERIHVRRAAALLVADSAEQLDSWLQDPDLANQLGRRLSPTAALVPGDSRVAVQAQLKQLGRGSRVVDYSAPPRKLFQVQEPATVELDPKRAEPYVRYRLAAFADPCSEGEAAPLRYRITESSVRRARAAGLKAEEIVSYLTTCAQGEIPADTLLRVRGWGGAYAPLNQTPVVAIQLPPGLTWSMLSAIPEVASALIRAATPTIGLIDPGQFPAAQQALAERGLELREGITTVDGQTRTSTIEIDEGELPISLRGVLHRLVGQRVSGALSPADAIAEAALGVALAEFANGADRSGER